MNNGLRAAVRSLSSILVLMGVLTDQKCLQDPSSLVSTVTAEDFGASSRQSARVMRGVRGVRQVTALQPAHEHSCAPPFSHYGRHGRGRCRQRRERARERGGIVSGRLTCLCSDPVLQCAAVQMMSSPPAACCSKCDARPLQREDREGGDEWEGRGRRRGRGAAKESCNNMVTRQTSSHFSGSLPCDGVWRQT